MSSNDAPMSDERLYVISNGLAPWDPALSGRDWTKRAACELLAEVFRLRARLTDLAAVATELQAATADHRDARAALNAVVEQWSKQTVDEREAIKKRIDQAQLRLFNAQDAWMAAAKRDWPEAEHANRNPTTEHSGVGKRREADGG